MTNFCVIDTETSISRGPHGPQAKDPTNDMYTIIAGSSASNVKVYHNPEGFKRQVPFEVAELINRADVIVMHNAPFDLSYLWVTKELQEFLLRGGQVYDTQIAEYLMSGQRHSFASLAELQNIYLGQKSKESRISALFKAGVGADKILTAKNRCPKLFKLYDKYSKDDGVTTMQIFQKQYAKAKQLGMIDVIKLYNMYMLTLTNVMNTGITVDLEKCEKTLREFKLKSLEYLEQATHIVQPMWDQRLGVFNVNSPKDKSAILFGGDYIIKKRVEDGLYKNGNPKFRTVEEEIHINGFGLPLGLSTPGAKLGQFATGADIIEKIYQNSKNEQAKEYCRLQKLAMTYNKMCSTYLEPFLELSVEGKLYPNYNNTMTITSRLSSSKPNLQNIPSKGEMLLPIQGQLVAPEGWVCVSADYCLAPETKVLTDDFKWVEIGTVKEGDTLIGFEEQARNHDGRKWEFGKVEKVKRLMKPCLRITTSECVITCSKDHMFLVSGSQCPLKWKRADELKLNNKFSKVMEVWETPDTYDAGWAAGFLDGEGYISHYSQIGLGQNNDGDNKLAYDKMCRLFDTHLINTENRFNTGRRCHIVRPSGMRTAWQAVGIFQPVRLKAKLKRTLHLSTLRSKRNRKIEILKIEDVGMQEVVAVQTSCKTFLAEGLMSHNCQLEIYVSAYLANDPQLTKDLLDGVDFHVKRLSYAENLPYQDVFKYCKINRLPEWESKRTSAKTISYQKAYGASPKSLAKTTGISEDVIKRIFDREDIEYPFVAEFNKKVLEQVNSSKELSQAKHLPKMKKGGGKEGKKFICGLELLPIINGEDIRYDADEYRHVGYYTAATGKRYSFEEIGRIDFRGNLKRGFSTTQTKNYHVQGTASDVQASSSAALLPLLLKNKDKVRMVNEIHDSKWFIVKVEYLDKILPIIKRVMEDVPGNFKKYLNVDMPFKIPVDFEIGPDFASTESYPVGDINERK